MSKESKKEKKKELVSRWNEFLDKIETRFNESLEQVEEALISQLIESDYDYNTCISSMGSMLAQIRLLTEKISETWDKKVRPKIYKLDEDLTYDLDKKNSKLEDKLYYKMEPFERKVEAKMSQLFYDHAIATASKNYQCSQCNAPIEIEKDLFKAQYVNCQFCSTANTFEPDAKFKTIGWNIIDNIVAYQLNEEYKKMTKLEKKISNQRPPLAQDLVDRYKVAYFDYYTKLYKECTKLNPMQKEYYENSMKNREKDYEIDLQRYS